MKTIYASRRFVKSFKPVFFFLMPLFFSFNAIALNYYWTGNGGNWSDLSHWSTTSGGTLFHTQLPTAADDVFFDANSFSSPGQEVNLDLSSNIAHDISWSGVQYNPTCAGLFSNDLEIYGSFTLSSAMTFDFAGPVHFLSTVTGEMVTTAGKVFTGYVIFDGAGGEWTLQDAFNSNAGISLFAGTLNTNDQIITCDGFFSGTNAPRTLNMGASVFNLTGDNAWSVSNPGITVNCGTSVINCIADSAWFGGGSINAVNRYNDVNFIGTIAGVISGPSDFHNVEFEAKGYTQGSCTFNDVIFKGDGVMGYYSSGTTFNDLSFTAGYKYEIGELTVNGNFSAMGTCTSLIKMHPIGNANAGYIHFANPADVSYVDMHGIYATGTGPFTVTHSFIGCCYAPATGWTYLATPGDLYWIGNGGNWSDPNHWSYTSGGSPAGCTPIHETNVFFDANSFSVPNQSVTIDVPSAYCGDIDWTNVTNTPRFTIPAQKNLRIFGSVSFATAMVLEPVGWIYFDAITAGHTITTRGQVLGPLIFGGYGIGEEWTLQDTFTTDSIIRFSGGILNTNNQTVNAVAFSFSGFYTPRTLNMGSSVFNLSGKYDAWHMDNSGNNVNCGTSVINLTNDTAYFMNNGFVSNSPFTFYDVNFTGNVGGIAGPFNFHNVVFNGNGGVTTSGNAHTLNALTFHRDGELNGTNILAVLNCTAGYVYKFQAGKTQTIQNSWLLQGTCTDSITVESRTPGTFATIIKTTDSIHGNFLKIKDIHATGGGVFMAENSTDLGGNAGWNFTGLPPLTAPGPINGPTAVCADGGIIIYHVTSQPGAVSYNWTVPPGAVIVSGQGDTLILVNFGSAASGYITVQASNGCNLSSMATSLAITVSSLPSPTVGLTASPATAVCPGVPVTFTAFASGAGTGNIIYDFKLNGISIQAGTADTFTSALLANGDQISCTVTVSNSSCFVPVSVSSNTVTVQIWPLLTPAVSLTANPGTAVCPATVVNFIASAINTGTGSVSYDFRVNGISVQSGALNSYTSPVLNGDHITCAIHVSSACYTVPDASSNTLVMVVNPAALPVQVNAGPDLSVTEGQTVQLSGSGDAGIYLWSPASGLNATDILNPMASPQATTIYKLTITNLFGCESSDEIKIDVKEPVSVDNCIVDPSNAFTPNGDGINDTWIVWKGICNAYPSVKVFNRSGTIVFQSERYQNNWQGLYKGKPLADGTYYSITTYTTVNGKYIVKRNDLTILR